MLFMNQLHSWATRRGIEIYINRSNDLCTLELKNKHDGKVLALLSDKTFDGLFDIVENQFSLICRAIEVPFPERPQRKIS
jgi:hypothetical protein